MLKGPIIVAQDGPGRTGPSRTNTVRDVKNSTLSGRLRTRMSLGYWGSVLYGEGCRICIVLALALTVNNP